MWKALIGGYNYFSGFIALVDNNSKVYDVREADVLHDIDVKNSLLEELAEMQNEGEISNFTILYIKGIDEVISTANTGYKYSEFVEDKVKKYLNFNEETGRWEAKEKGAL